MDPMSQEFEYLTAAPVWELRMKQNAREFTVDAMSQEFEYLTVAPVWERKCDRYLPRTGSPKQNQKTLGATTIAPAWERKCEWYLPRRGCQKQNQNNTIGVLSN